MDGVDIGSVLGNDIPVVSRMKLPDAIAEGILPTPDYVLAKVSFEEELENLEVTEGELIGRRFSADNTEKKQIDELVGRVRSIKNRIGEASSIPQIFKKELITRNLENGKFIVFCPAGNEGEGENTSLIMESYMKQAKDWFRLVGTKEPTVYAVHNNYGTKANVKAIRDFEQDKSNGIKLLFSVNMLNEGKHVDDIDGVIMLRSTHSNIIYYQELGRALAVCDEDEQDKPIIFDFVANLDNTVVNQVKGLQTNIFIHRKKNKNINGAIKKQTKTEMSDNFDIETYNIDLYDELTKLNGDIEEFLGGFNFDKFYSYLKMYYDEHGHCRVPRFATIRNINGKTILCEQATEQGDLVYNLGSYFHTVKNMRKGISLDRRSLTEAQYASISALDKNWDMNDSEYIRRMLLAMSKVYAREYNALNVLVRQKILVTYKNNRQEIYNFGALLHGFKQDVKNINSESLGQRDINLSRALLKLDKNCLVGTLELANKKFLQITRAYCDKKLHLRVPKFQKAEITYIDGRVEHYNLGRHLNTWRARKDHKSSQDIKELELMDADWATSDTELSARKFMHVMKRYYNEYGNLGVKNREKVLIKYDNGTTEVYNLGLLLTSRRDVIKGVKRGVPLSLEYQQELSRMDPNWLDTQMKLDDRMAKISQTLEKYVPNMQNNLGILDVRCEYTDQDIVEPEKEWVVQNTGQFDDNILQVRYYETNGYVKEYEEVIKVSEPIMVDESMDEMFAGIESVRMVSDEWLAQNMDESSDIVKTIRQRNATKKVQNTTNEVTQESQSESGFGNF